MPAQSPSASPGGPAGPCALPGLPPSPGALVSDPGMRLRARLDAEPSPGQSRPPRARRLGPPARHGAGRGLPGTLGGSKSGEQARGPRGAAVGDIRGDTRARPAAARGGGAAAPARCRRRGPGSAAHGRCGGLPAGPGPVPREGRGAVSNPRHSRDPPGSPLSSGLGGRRRSRGRGRRGLWAWPRGGRGGGGGRFARALARRCHGAA